MSFNSVTLTIAAIIFVILLAMTAFFIYQEQKSKFDISPSTCPDFWTLEEGNEGLPYICRSTGVNMGSCDDSQDVRPTYAPTTKSTKLCDLFADKYNYISTTCNKGNKRINWDGVTNNPDLISKCKITVPST
jgi:hypothetical protein